MRIYPKPIGTLPYSMQNKFIGSPFMLNVYQLRYLQEAQLIPGSFNCNFEKYLVFKHFTDLRYTVRDGCKFGCDFLAYPGDPLYSHATKMILVAKEITKFRLVQLGRISNDTKKELVISFVVDSTVVCKNLTWVNTGARERKIERTD